MLICSAKSSYLKVNPVLIRPSKIPLVNRLILEVWFAVWDVLGEIAFSGFFLPLSFSRLHMERRCRVGWTPVAGPGKDHRLRTRRSLLFQLSA